MSDSKPVQPADTSGSSSPTVTIMSDRKTLRPVEMSGSSSPAEKEKQTMMLKEPPPRAAGPKGILTVDHIATRLARNRLEVVSAPQYRGIPLLAISLLDIANSSDFAANVFNETPVPHFAMALMALGGTFALVMTVVAGIDARRSWRAIKLLRQERRDLSLPTRAESESEDEKRSQSTMHNPTMFSLNQRDTRVEFFERAGMETAMGIATFLVSIGTYMAIGGENRKVFVASNLLSGYIGNSPPALYGLLNTWWTAVAWQRGRRQKQCAATMLPAGSVQTALRNRATLTQRHAIISGAACLVSGALGLLTPTHWQPYPVLLVCGLLFMYTTWVLRTRLNYHRPLFSSRTQVYTMEEVRDELEQLLLIQSSARKEKVFLSRAYFGSAFSNSFTATFRLIVNLGLFEQFCDQVLADNNVNAMLRREWKDVTQLTCRDFLALDQHIQDRLASTAKDCLNRHGPKQVPIRIRFLLEYLGSCLTVAKAQQLEEGTP